MEQKLVNLDDNNKCGHENEKSKFNFYPFNSLWLYLLYGQTVTIGTQVWMTKNLGCIQI